MPIYLGPVQVGECARCSFKYRRDQLMEDGYVPHLLVCATCWEPDHPQDYPAPPRPEGLPPYKPAPQVRAYTDPVLSNVDDALSWDSEIFQNEYMTTVWQIYYRETAEEEWALVATQAVEYTQYAAVEDANNTYTGTVGFWKVHQLFQSGAMTISNILEIVEPPAAEWEVVLFGRDSDGTNYPIIQWPLYQSLDRDYDNFEYVSVEQEEVVGTMQGVIKKVDCTTEWVYAIGQKSIVRVSRDGLTQQSVEYPN